MGVDGLWNVVAPAGRRVNLDTLEGRVMAVDSSIWMVQFLKAMRDPNGNMVRAAHLVGFFRRICKLLYYRIRPVFVFDGTPPPLKFATLMQRRQFRDQQDSNLKKTAERLLLARLKGRVLAKASAIKKSKKVQPPIATQRPAESAPLTETPSEQHQNNNQENANDFKRPGETMQPIVLLDGTEQTPSDSVTATSSPLTEMIVDVRTTTSETGRLIAPFSPRSAEGNAADDAALAPSSTIDGFRRVEEDPMEAEIQEIEALVFRAKKKRKQGTPAGSSPPLSLGSSPPVRSKEGAELSDNDDVELDTGSEALANASDRRARRIAYYNSIPQEFT